MADPPLRKFNQTNRITSRLRDLVRSYPKGIGLVKEFLQNADDAGASCLHVTFDHRRHPGHLANEEQAVVLGPALLLANDKTFGADDLENIQHIDEGGKLREARGIGRFGQGVNTFYSVSDHPTLLTGDTIVWFDPHQRAHGDRQNAWAWALADVAETWPAWAATFEPAGLVLGSPRFEGTVFRLPIRSARDAARSEILPQEFTYQSFEHILEEVRRVGTSLLVFLRSVQSLRLDEIDLNSERRTRYMLTTTNPDEVEAARAPLRMAVRGNTRELLARWLASPEPLPTASYHHAFELLSDGERTQVTWSVMTGLFRGPNDDLLKHADAICCHDEKALPWAGAATPLNADVPVGRISCFLPLLEPMPWPVLLHGWFDVDSSRRGITRQAGIDEIDQLRVLWNQKLLQHGVGPAWAALVEQVRSHAGADTDPYRLWPVPSDARDEHDRALVRGFYANIVKRPVFRCATPDGAGWRSLEGIGKGYWSLPGKWHQELRDLLLADGHAIIDPQLPGFAVQVLKSEYPDLVLSAEFVRDELKALAAGVDINCALTEAPRKSMRRAEWVASLASFCSKDKQEWLAGLPLALLADRKLHTFGSCGPIYLATDAERSLLTGAPHRIVDPQFQTEIGLTGDIPALNVRKLDLAGLLACVREVLAAGPVDGMWLARLFEQLEQFHPSEVAKHRESLCALELVPDQTGRLHTMGNIKTPLMLDQVPPPLWHAFAKLGVPMLIGPEPLPSAIQRFAARHQRFVWRLTPGDLADMLALHARSPWLRQDAFLERAVLDPILTFLSPPAWVEKKGDAYVKDLRRLRWLPTTDGIIVSAETKNLYVPGGFVPPQGASTRHLLLDVGADGRWAKLFRALQVDEWDGRHFVVGALLPAFRDFPDEMRVQMLRWLRDNLRKITTPLAPEDRGKLFSAVREAAILPLVGGGLGAACQTYGPGAKDAQEMLGEVARVPDVECLGADPEHWSEFFADLRLLRAPLPAHLLEALRRCANEANSQGVSAALRKRLAVIRKYIVDHWDGLGNPREGGSKEFADALSGLAWLPVDGTAPERVAARSAWPERLYRANELVAPRFLHLVSSVRPVLEGPGLPDGMARALGMAVQIPLDEVLKHFNAVRDIDLGTAGDETRRACRRAFADFVEHIDGLPDKDRATWEAKLAPLKGSPSILLRGAWWPARRVFVESLPFQTDWCISFLADPELAGRPPIVSGLSRLGVRPSPKSSDWVEMLKEQRDRTTGPLTDGELDQVHAALQQLRVEDRTWLQNQPIHVPTADRRLLLARDVLLPDDPRLKRLVSQSPLPLVEEIEVSLEVATRAGARSLRTALDDRLADDPVPSQNSDLIAWTEEQTRRLRSPGLQDALRRLAWHEAVEGGSTDPQAAAGEERLTLPGRLDLRIACALHVTSEFRDTGAVVFEQSANSFWDREASILWLTQGSKRKMNDELARTLATECRLDALRLSRLLDAGPEEMVGILDEDRIAVIPTGAQESVPPAWLPPDEPEPAIVAPDDEGALHPSSVQVPETGPRPPRVSWSGGASASAAVPASGEPPSVEGLSEVPARPGFGSSQPWSPDLPRKDQGRARLRSYPHPSERSDYDTSPTGSEEAQATRREALLRVIEWEKVRGRTAVEVPDRDRGYALESSGMDGIRHIEVKGIDGPWTARGVPVSSQAFRMAVEAGSSWWLYVVEHAREPERAIVTPLHQPFLEATEYRFDGGWRAIATGEKAESEGPVEGEEVPLEDGTVAPIIEMERRGQLWLVTVRRPDGREEVLPWSTTSGSRAAPRRLL